MTRLKKSATPKEVPRPRKNIFFFKKLFFDDSTTKSVTPKKVPRPNFFDENLPQNGTQMDQKIDQREKKNSPILFLTMYLYHNIYKSSYNIVNCHYLQTTCMSLHFSLRSILSGCNSIIYRVLASILRIVRPLYHHGEGALSGWVIALFSPSCSHVF